MKKILILALCLCTVAGLSAQKRKKAQTPAPEPAAHIELKSQSDTISYLMGSLIVREIVLDLDFLKETIDPQIFLAGAKDAFEEKVIDLGLDIDYLSEFIEEGTERYREQAASERERRLQEMFDNEGYSLLQEDVYIKIVQQGTGTPVTDPDQILSIRVRLYDQDGDPMEDIPEYDLEEESAGDFLEFLGEEYEQYVAVGTIFRIAAKMYEDYGYYGYEEPEYQYVEYEITGVSDPVGDQEQ